MSNPGGPCSRCRGKGWIHDLERGGEYELDCPTCRGVGVVQILHPDGSGEVIAEVPAGEPVFDGPRRFGNATKAASILRQALVDWRARVGPSRDPKEPDSALARAVLVALEELPDVDILQVVVRLKGKP